MWFAKKRNVRQADLRERRQDLRRRIYRSLWWTMCGLLALDAAGIGIEVNRFLMHSPYLALKTVDITGMTRVTAREVTVLGQLDLGQNLLSTDLEQVSQDIRRHPWISGVHIRRVLPDRLQIQVVEREPAALLAMGDLYYVDRTGRPFKKVNAGDSLGFPVLTGFEKGGLLATGPVGRKAIQEALTLIDQVATQLPLGRDRISEVHLDPAHGFSIFAAPSGAQIHLGWDPFTRKLERLAHLLGQERLNLAQVRRIDVDLEKSAVVTPL